MKNPRSDTKVFAMLECFAEHGAMNLDEAIDLVGNISWKSSRSGMKRILDDAVKQGYLIVKGDKYQISESVIDYVFDVMEFKSKKPKRDLVASPYRNIWTPEMKGYTASLYRNKRGYERN